MYKQVIIVRKDLNMSYGKFSAQANHASMAFLTTQIKNNAKLITENDEKKYRTTIDFDVDLFEEWICGPFTKVVLEAKNKNHLLKAIEKAKELGLKENEDYFVIKDNCYTELTPEEFDEDGVGHCLTCIGFKPMDDSIINQIGKKYQLYKG